MEKPKILAMVICDDVIEDKRTNKKSLVGIFNRIMAKKFPAKHHRMHIFFSLSGGMGKYKTSLRYTYLKNMKVLGHIDGEIQFSDPTAILEADFQFVDVVFPYEGKYNFELLINNEPVVERIFEVVRG